MISKIVSAILFPALLLLAVSYTVLPELGHEAKAAALSGDPAAQVELARMHYEGDGVQQDLGLAVHWLAEAAGQNYPDAQNTLGQFYINGHGVTKDEAKGLELIHAAAEQEHPKAQAYLAFAYGRGVGVEQDLDKFLSWVQRAAGNNEPRSLFNVALLKLTGNLLEQDVPGAKTMLAKSADQGYTEAQVTLGEFLVRGIDGKPDVVEACKWFAIAGTKGNRKANAYLMEVVKTMTKEQMDEAADRANKWLSDRGEGV